MSDIQIHNAREGARSIAAATLAASLMADPFYQAITVDFEHDVEARLRALERYFAYSLEEADRTGRSVIADPPDLGASAWLLPRTHEVDSRESAAKAAYFSEILGTVGYRRYQHIIDVMADHAERVMPASVWYLSIVGVHPSAQGRGVGFALLRPTLAEADASGAPCYLETFAPRTHPFYTRLGFTLAAEHLEPITQSIYAIMCRQPQPTAPLKG